MSQPLMPKATAIWLLDNTTLTFEQIGTFCGLHSLEVQAIADGDIAAGMAPFDPIASNQLTQEEIDLCMKDPSRNLVGSRPKESVTQKRRGGGRYTPVSKRQDKPNGIAWLLKNHPELSDRQICQLLGTTNPTIRSIREKTHPKMKDLTAKSPVSLGLCTQEALELVVSQATGDESAAND
ncbi:MAG: cell cycle transcriptional regulator TrcR [Alphaproteobacteria bacterium]